MSNSRFMRWLRVVVVSDQVLWFTTGTVLVVWLLQQFLRVWIYWVVELKLTEAELKLTDAPIHTALVPFIAFVFGLFRVQIFHPILNRPYGRWLATTPWQYPAPLPLGPIRLVWQDAVVIGMLMALALLPPWNNLALIGAVPLLFLAGYCLSLAGALFRTNFLRACAVYGVLLGCGLLACSYPPSFALVALALVGVSFLAIRSLRDFPYTASRRSELGLSGSAERTEAETYLTISPLADEFGFDLITPRRAISVALLAGWLMFAIATQPMMELNVRGLLMIHIGFCMVLILARLIAYGARRLPPISLLGRIATKKYVVPKYDRMFLAPLAATVATFLLPAVLLAMRIWPALAIAASTSIVVWLAVALPPNFRDWYYTGHFRMIAPTGSQQKQPRVRAGS